MLEEVASAQAADAGAAASAQDVDADGAAAQAGGVRHVFGSREGGRGCRSVVAGLSLFIALCSSGVHAFDPAAPRARCHGTSPRSQLRPEAARLARSRASGACRVPASRKRLWLGPPCRTACLHARLPGRRSRAPQTGKPRTRMRRPRRRPPQAPPSCPPRAARARPPLRRRPAQRRWRRCGGRRRTRTARSSSRRAARG